MPFLETMTDLGRDGFVDLLLNDPDRERGAGLVLDVAHAILQNGERYEDQATDAFQEVVSDLYDGFLSMADRLGVNPPDHSTVAPLVKWGNPDFGPYTWTISATESIGLGTGIVSLPPANARRGMLAGDGPLQVIFDRAKSLLKMMHDANPSWGPLFVLHPGNLVRHPTYRRK